MNKKQSKRRRDIKSKLMAAICMLLVSSIMMVSTTYAWFTLSTAPEVTGINTAVGANGNLEIALLPKSGELGDITSQAGDSILAIEAKNVTWGNLVDLSDGSVYGLDSITLFPAALNASYDENTGEMLTVGDTLLQTPTYGGDGRVAQLNANTVNGYYDAGEKDFYPNEDYGVRAVGTASGMTPRQLAYRNARSSANDAAAKAKSNASQSLNSNGSTLANIAIKKGTGNENYDQADVAALQAIVDDLLGSETKTGVLQYVEKAYMQYILAYAASAAIEDATDSVFTAVQDLVDAEGATLNSVKAGLANAGVASLPTEIDSVISSFNSTKAKVEAANTQLETLATMSSIAWGDISPVLLNLADPDQMRVNGILASEIMQGDNMSNLVNSVASGGLKVTMSTGGGVYADIADHCGDYTASVVIEEVSYGGLTLKNMTARMETKSSVTISYLSAAGSAVENAGAPASSSAVAQPITDMFGYVVDLAFRTNAAESNLLLQVDAVDRIYGDNENSETMGHGSCMTFTSAGELTDEQVAELIQAIRLVFFDATNSNVIVCGKLNAPEKQEDGSWKSTVSLYNETKVDNVVTQEPVEDNVVMALPQNVAVSLSVLVYLDGNHVGNEDVAASAATSLTGTLNLQFASSATLVPMDYSQLHTPKTSSGGSSESTPTPSENGTPESQSVEDTPAESSEAAGA